VAFALLKIRGLYAPQLMGVKATQMPKGQASYIFRKHTIFFAADLVAR
jgi:hypothetical protein